MGQATPPQKPRKNAPTATIAPTDDQTPAATENAPLSLADGITQKQLADRLRANRESIRKNANLGREHFAQWTKEGSERPQSPRNPDPDGLAWERRSNGLYYPLTPTD